MLYLQMAREKWTCKEHKNMKYYTMQNNDEYDNEIRRIKSRKKITFIYTDAQRWKVRHNWFRAWFSGFSLGEHPQSLRGSFSKAWPPRRISLSWDWESARRVGRCRYRMRRCRPRRRLAHRPPLRVLQAAAGGQRHVPDSSAVRPPRWRWAEGDCPTGCRRGRPGWSRPQKSPPRQPQQLQQTVARMACSWNKYIFKLLYYYHHFKHEIDWNALHCTCNQWIAWGSTLHMHVCCITQHIDFRSLQNVLHVYSPAIENNITSTKHAWNLMYYSIYLHQIQTLYVTCIYCSIQE